LFFADQPDQLAQEDQPYGHAAPPGGGTPYGQPPAPGQRPVFGQPWSQQANPQAGPDQGAQPPPRQWQLRQRPAGQRPVRQRPVRQRPTKPPGRELRQRAIASLVLGLLSLVALFGLGADLSRGVWLLLFSAVIGTGSSVIGITAVVKARRTGTFRPGGAIGGIVLGAFAVLISVSIIITYLEFPTSVNNYVKCVNQAQTSTQQHACVTKFRRSIHLGSAGEQG
jgi:hypothetical protein